MWTVSKNVKFGVAIYNYDGKAKFGLPLEIGETVQVLEECAGWYRGFSTRNKAVKGIFPASFIHSKPVAACVVDNEGPYETVTPVEDTTVREVGYVLKEWNGIWKRQFVSRHMVMFNNVKGVMQNLLSFRRQLLSSTLNTQEQKRAIKAKIVSKIDWINGQLGLDLVPRVENEQVDPDRISVIDLFRLHKQGADNNMNASAQVVKQINENKVVFASLLNSIPRDQALSGGSVRREHEQGDGLNGDDRVANAKSAIIRQSQIVKDRPPPLFPRRERISELKILKHAGRHLFHCSLEMRKFLLDMQNPSDVFFGIYDFKTGEYISEKFLARLTKNGLPEQFEKLHHNTAIFTDLGNDDLVKDVYMVAHIYRKGVMLPADASSKKGGVPHYRRPYGCSVLSIKEVLLNQIGHDDDKEFHMKVYCCSEENFSSLHENIIRKKGNYNLASGQTNYGMVVAMRMLHGDLDTVKRENPLLFTKNIAVCRRMGFSDVIRPGDVRNDLYLTICSGEFEKGRKKSGKNIEVIMFVLDESGKPIENAISMGSGEPNVTEFRSVVFYHSDKPKWLETVKLNVPLEKFPKAHFRMDFRHGSTKTGNKLCDFAFAKLVNENGATIGDGRHELFLYKCENAEASKLAKVSNYIKLPSSAEDGTTHTGNSLFQRSTKELVIINSLLCSTKFTQNVDLLGFLKWRTQPEKLEMNINKLMTLGGEEIVKFLSDILDALFSMLAQTTTHKNLVFKALVYIFNLLKDEKFEHFRPVIDNYISDVFSALLVFKDMLGCLVHQVKMCYQSKRPTDMSKTFEVLEYIFKFMVQSRKLFSRASGDQEQLKDFKEILMTFIRECGFMLKSTQEPVVNSQVTLLSNLSSVYPDLLKLLSCADVTAMVSILLNSMPKDQVSIAVKVKEVKLQFLRDTIGSKLFEEPESRTTMLTLAMSQLKRHLITDSNLLLTVNILGDILTFLQSQEKAAAKEAQACGDNEMEKVESVHEDICLVVSSLLSVVAQVVLRVERQDKAAGLLVACLINMFKLMDEGHYKAIFDQMKPKQPLKRYLVTVFRVFKDLLQAGVFPKDWMVMKMVTNSVILSTMQFFGQALRDQFLGNDFDLELWSDYFNLAVAFVTQQCLQLEKFSKAKREKVIEKYGDMRVPMGVDIESMWQSLGTHKICFIPNMVGPFLEVTVVPETELRKATLPIFFDMMECEQKARGHFKQVESELIDKLDRLLSQNKGDDQYRELFQNMMQDKIDTQPDWKESGSAFIQSVTRLLERLLDYRRAMSGDSNYSQKMICTVNLLNFYKNEINREEMYIRYIYKLRDLHIQGENFTEAGFALKLHADMLNWSEDYVEADLSFPDQMKWKRKELIYKQIIEYFDKGKSWEHCLPLCKELAELYEKKFDYAKLSNILKKQATFLDNILNQPRFEFVYFRQGFYGQAWPTFLRNKTFICRGNTFERLGEFKSRVMIEHQNAQLLNRLDPPDPSIFNGETPYIQLCTVKPNPVEERAELSGGDVPMRIAEYYKVNEIDTFQFDRPFHEGKKDDKNEFKTLCLERTTMKISTKLPGLLKYFEVVKSNTINLSPIETAIDTMENMNAELHTLISTYSGSNPEKNINPLTMRLHGVIDAAVMGGPKHYKEAFCSQDFCIEHPEHVDNIVKLKGLLTEQVTILEKGMKLHSKLHPPDILQLHQRLEACFKETKKAMRWSGSYSDTASLQSASDSDPFDLSRPESTTSSSSSRPSCSSGISEPAVPSGGQTTSILDEDIYALPDSPKDLYSEPPPGTPLYAVGELPHAPMPKPKPTKPKPAPKPPRESLQIGGAYSELPDQPDPNLVSAWKKIGNKENGDTQVSPSSDSGTSSTSPSPRSSNSAGSGDKRDPPALPPRTGKSPGQENPPSSPVPTQHLSAVPPIPARSTKRDSAPIDMQSHLHSPTSGISPMKTVEEPYPPALPPKHCSVRRGQSESANASDPQESPPKLPKRAASMFQQNHPMPVMSPYRRPSAPTMTLAEDDEELRNSTSTDM
ncbi:dedicator of cytokinesis protein 3-like isoform X3 [Lineus longissimus]|uniref:dedicator of cytokinesis protein 3-like isoform X3 n=1 Tax=Lineus longissimus TaxID=88925 RepID=UPI00315D8A89